MLMRRRPADAADVGAKIDDDDANRDLPAAAGRAWSCWQRMMRSERLSKRRALRNE